MRCKLNYICNLRSSMHSGLLLSRFSCVRLCETPQTAAHQAPRPWDSPGKDTGVGYRGLHVTFKVGCGNHLNSPSFSCLTYKTGMIEDFQEDSQLSECKSL